MAQWYNIQGYTPAGDPWNNPRGGQLQSYFLDIEGVDGTVLTNKKIGNTPRIGNNFGTVEHSNDRTTGQPKFDKKGRPIYKFTSERADQATTPAPAEPFPSASSTAPIVPTTGGESVPVWFAPYAVMIKKIHDIVHVGTVTVETPTPEETTNEDDKIPGTNLSKAELEDIFGGSMEPVEITD